MEIKVIDTGVGIKREDIDKLFKLFGFLESSRELNVKGIGLGLYICKKITTIFGGDINVKSTYREGSVFTFSFELEELQNEQGQQIDYLRNLNPVQRSMRAKINIDREEHKDNKIKNEYSYCDTE